MKKSNITNILKQIISEDADTMRAVHLGTLRGYLEGGLIPKINMAVKRDEISQAFASELVADIQNKLDMVQSSNSLSKAGPGIGESTGNKDTKKLYSKEEVVKYIKNHPTAKYYKIAATKDSSRVLRNYQEAIEVVNQSIIKQFELEVYGQTIQFSAPFDEKYAALVGSFGTRGT